MKHGLTFWIALLLAVMMMALTLAATCSNATHPLSKGGKHKPAPATLIITPTSPSAGSYYVVTGYGFPNNVPVDLRFYSPNCCVGTLTSSDDHGQLIPTTGWAAYAGLGKVEAFIFDGRSWVMIGSISFPII